MNWWKWGILADVDTRLTPGMFLFVCWWFTGLLHLADGRSAYTEIVVASFIV